MPLGVPDESGTGVAGPLVTQKVPRPPGALIGMVEVQGYMVQGYMPWTSMEPSGRAAPRHSTALNGVRREAQAGRGWTGSKEETSGGPGHRAEPDDDPRCTGGRWRLATISANRQW